MKRTYIKRFIAGMITYMVLVPISLTLLDNIEENSVIRFAVALLPVLPVLFIIFAFLDYLRSLDDLQRLIQLQAFGFSLGATGLITFTLGFLENAGGPELSMIWVLPMMIIFWGIGQAIANRRYE